MKKYRKAPPKKTRTDSPLRERNQGSGAGRANLYGFHAVAAAWLNPARKITALYLTDKSMQNFQSVLDGAHGLDRPAPQIITKHDIDRVCPKDSVHQGVALFCDDLPEMDVRDLIIKNRDAERPLFVILDQITDPHNVGAILRSAAAFGAKGVIMQRRHSPELSGVLAKSASGALEHIDIALDVNISRAIEKFQEDFYTVYGLDERGEKEIGNAEMSDKSVLVLGAEGPGLRQKVKETCDHLIRIPMTSALASINVSNAAAVSLYAWMSQK